MLFNRFRLKAAGPLVLMYMFNVLAFSQEKSDSLPVRLMFYNTENLFDTYDDTIKEDDAFLPGGLMRWNRTRYFKKINSVYKTIIAAGEWNPPAIVGLCEVENRKVLEDLVYRTPLSNFGYGIVHEESPDPRGIDVCMIFRKEIVSVIDHKAWIPEGISKGEFHSRNVLYVKCTVFGDTIHLIINHWPSRRGGVLAGEPMREEVAAMVRNAVDSLHNSSGNLLKVIVFGDFNCSPDDPVISSLIKGPVTRENILHNLSDHHPKASLGTYRYMGTWETIDQVIVSEDLLTGNRGLYAEKKNLRIFRPDFLLRNDSKYPGMTTFSTYSGYRYIGGFSDHLPVLLDIGFR